MSQLKDNYVGHNINMTVEMNKRYGYITQPYLLTAAQVFLSL